MRRKPAPKSSFTGSFKSTPKNTSFDLTKIYPISTIDKDLDGIIKLEEHLIKVPFTLIGDKVLIKQINANKSIPMAQKVELVEQAGRLNPICSYYGKCGGCKAQHFPSKDYLNYKLQNIKNAIRHQTITDNLPPLDNLEIINHLDNPLGHRRRAIFSVKDGTIGFKEYRTNNVLSIKMCPLLTPNLNSFLVSMEKLLKNDHSKLGISEIIVADLNEGINFDQTSSSKSSLDILIKSSFKPDFAVLNALQSLFDKAFINRILWQINDTEALPLIIKSPTKLYYGEHAVDFAGGGFLQVSNFGEKSLQEFVIKAINNNEDNQGKQQDFLITKNVLDLFCGFGGYSFKLEKNPQILKIKAYDVAKEAIMAINKVGVPKITAYLKDIFKDPLKVEELNKADAIIINPPRIGALSQVIEIEKSDNIKKIIMIYCNVASFARDLKILLSSGKFNIKIITAVDQFIFSSHIEILAVLIKK
ncbi:Class I SAM-dependent methyltransferase [Candidatus Hepatincolaceae symbiont of Richtersius coronifer]